MTSWGPFQLQYQWFLDSLDQGWQTQLPRGRWHKYVTPARECMLCVKGQPLFNSSWMEAFRNVGLVLPEILYFKRRQKYDIFVWNLILKFYTWFYNFTILWKPNKAFLALPPPPPPPPPHKFVNFSLEIDSRLDMIHLGVMWEGALYQNLHEGLFQLSKRPLTIYL